MIATALQLLLVAAPLGWGEGRQAFVDPGALAEIEPSAVGAAVLRELDPGAIPLEGSPRVRLWRLSSPSSARVLEVLEGKRPGRFAPVFHDQPSPASKLRVPAGGVLVWLARPADPVRWAALRRLVVKQQFEGGALLLQSAPGAATLAMAAALRGDPQVKRVMPNWWLRAVRR